ncbi:MAG: UvrD-helicase domain-containing protein [Bacteroidota bacterium]|nr:UvrD-helicase domain-containing protein [Bacteroidota bacterium]MDP4234583.1 UvrD-helicase domain-containing protein [Bacteroidota bacterium]MDP4243712.1 UvrD-helicase domain-containing protein [Bacteroidota bacterium]MDP4288340.1 UvrD-helicase domain-containing protein [Bacteroidota bacterium]
MPNILSGLNEAQLEAVRNSNGPTMIVAGAGSGKTRVLTHRIAFLLENGVKPWQILSLTFTNKAAREMKERISGMVEPEWASALWMGTFHSVFARLLRRHAKEIGYTSSFTIYDSDDSLSAIKQVMNGLSISKEQFNPNAVRSRISSAKNQLVYPEEYQRLARDFFAEQVAQIYPEYVRVLKSSNAMDFDDLLLKTIDLFDAHPEVLIEYQNKFRYVLVDEYQDTNRAQYAIIKRLAAQSRNLTVVGDDAQSIYAFRGADIGNILDFERDWPEAKIFRLEQNYRSTKNILATAGELIKNNKGQIPKTLFTNNPHGDPVRIIECMDERDEASAVVRAIEDEARKEKLDLRDFAILYRTNAQSRALEDALRRQGIPYTIVGGTAFYKRKEIKDVLGYVRLLVNPTDTESLMRVINYPARGIGQTTLERIQAYARDHGITMLAALESIDFVTAIQPRIAGKIREFVRLIQRYSALKEQMSPGELMRALIDETNILQDLKLENTMDSLARRENIQEFLSAITDYFHEKPEAKLETFLEEVALVSEVDTVDGSKNTVTMMTLHAAKGLEFPVVCITGLEEGLFPSQASKDDAKALEEERRLLYVGITRAKSKCYIYYALARLRFGETVREMPSRFVEELEPSGSTERVTSYGTKPRERQPATEYQRETSYLLSGSPQVNGRTFTRKRRERDPLSRQETAAGPYIDGDSPTNYSQTEETIHRGVRVYHETFGEGRVLEVAGRGEKAKATVEFAKFGRKNLMLKFANLKLL